MEHDIEIRNVSDIRITGFFAWLMLIVWATWVLESILVLMGWIVKLSNWVHDNWEYLQSLV